MKSLRARYIRSAVIPDMQVRLLNLCLNDDENGMQAYVTYRESTSINWHSDSILQEIISDRISNKATLLPIAQRKRKIYEDAVKQKEQEADNFWKTVNNLGAMPITVRKYLLCQQSKPA